MVPFCVVFCIAYQSTRLVSLHRLGALESTEYSVVWYPISRTNQIFCVTKMSTMKRVYYMRGEGKRNFLLLTIQ